MILEYAPSLIALISTFAQSMLAPLQRQTQEKPSAVSRLRYQY
jgi:hypothetical protein